MRMQWVVFWRWAWTVLVCAVIIGGTIAFVGCLWSLPGCTLFEITGPAPVPGGVSPPASPGQGPPIDDPYTWSDAAVYGGIALAGVMVEVARRKFVRRR